MSLDGLSNIDFSVEPWDQIPLEDARMVRVIGEYQQREATEIVNGAQERIAIEPGVYPVVGSLTPDGSRVLEGRIFYQGSNVETGERMSHIQLQDPNQLRELERDGKLDLAPGVTLEMPLYCAEEICALRLITESSRESDVAVIHDHVKTWHPEIKVDENHVDCQCSELRTTSDKDLLERYITRSSLAYREPMPAQHLTKDRREGEERSHDDRRYRMDVIGEYQQRAATELLDRDKERIAIEPGQYPVVGALSLDRGRILEAGVMYQGVNVATGAPTGLVEFHKPERLRELVRDGKLELAPSVKPEMLQERSAKLTPLEERRQEKTREQAPEKRVALRR